MTATKILKLPKTGTVATGLKRAGAGAEPENAPSAHNGDNIKSNVQTGHNSPGFLGKLGISYLCSSVSRRKTHHAWHDKVYHCRRIEDNLCTESVALEED